MDGQAYRMVKMSKKGRKIMKHYDYLVVGAGLFGATFAYEAKKRGKDVLVIDKRDHIAGNIYTKEHFQLVNYSLI